MYKRNLLGAASGDLLKNAVIVDLIPVCGLHLLLDAVQLLLDGILGGGVQHLALDRGVIGAPDRGGAGAGAGTAIGRGDESQE